MERTECVRREADPVLRLPQQTNATGSQAWTADLNRLERLAEQAYAARYDVPPLRGAKSDYESACLYFQQAIEEAERLGLSGEAARLTQRRDDVCAVYDS